MEKVEKNMKRWLKRRVKVSLVTIVAFLITGIASYSDDYVIYDTDNFENSNKIIGVLDKNNIYYTGNGVAIYGNVKNFSNNGMIIGNGKDGISFQGGEVTNLNNNGIIGGFLTKEGIESGYYNEGNGITDNFSFLDNSGIITSHNTSVVSNSNLKNTGIIKSYHQDENKGIAINLNKKFDSSKYSNYGIIAGKKLIKSYIDGEIDSKTIADKGIAIKLNEDGSINSVVNGTGGYIGSKEVINADVKNNDSSIDITEETQYESKIINGVGTETGTLNISANTTINNSIINGYNTAVNINEGNLTAFNTIFNGGGLDGTTAVIKNKGGNNINLSHNSIVNGNIDLGEGNTVFETHSSYVNGDILSGKGDLTISVEDSHINGNIKLAEGNHLLNIGDSYIRGDISSKSGDLTLNSNNTEIFGNIDIGNGNHNITFENSKFGESNRISSVNIGEGDTTLKIINENYNSDFYFNGELKLAEGNHNIIFDKNYFEFFDMSVGKGNSEIDISNSIFYGFKIVLNEGASEINISNSSFIGNYKDDFFSAIIQSKGENNKLNLDTITMRGTKIEGFKNINIDGKNILDSNSIIQGTENINLKLGSQLTIGVGADKSEDGTYKTNALFNQSDNKLTITGEVTDEDLTIEENELETNYNKVSIINIDDTELSKGAIVDLGNTKIEDEVWVKTDSILTSAIKNETEEGTTITIEAEKDIYNLKSDKPIEPTTKKYYDSLNNIYKGIYSSNDENFIKLKYIIKGNLTEANKGDYTTITEEQQMATLLAYLKEIYTETPYSFSSEASRKSLDMFANIIKENNFKTKDGEIITYGGLTHNNGTKTDRFYGKNYHGFDIGSSDTDVDSQITGAYGQLEKGLSDSTSVGLILGGNNNKVDVSSSNLKGSSGYIGSYLKHDRGAFRGTIGFGLQYTDWKVHRNDLGGAYKENYSDRGLNIYAEGKYSKELSKGLFLEPKAGLNYDYIKQESINEGEKVLSLSVDEKEFNIVTGNVGLDLRKEIITRKGKHNLTAGVNYTRILSGADEDNLIGSFGGKSFDILVPQKTKDNVSVGLKYDIELENGVMLGAKASYDVPFKESTDNHTHKGRGEWTVGIGLGYRFNSLKELTPINIVDSFREERKVNLSSENYFDFDKSEIKTEGKAVIKAISSEIENEGLKGTLKIEGHTDSIGAPEYNQKLSERRAKSVEEEFKKNLTKEVEYEVKGYGETKPIDTNTTSEGRARNRRVDIEFTEVK